MLPNDNQIREAALDISYSAIVKAPAGSGKTSLLTARLLALLATVKTPEECLAITFTKKAANEMRERVLAVLESCCQSKTVASGFAGKLQVLAARVLQQSEKYSWDILKNPSRLKIQTIDSFCSYLTTNMPVLAKFGADPKIEIEAVGLYQAAVTSLLETELFSTKVNPNLLLLLQNLGNNINLLEKLCCTLLALREQWLPLIYSKHAAIDNLKFNLTRFTVSIFAEYLKLLPQHLRELLPEKISFAITNKTAAPQYQLLQNLTRWPEAQIEELETWQCLLSWLMTKEGKIRRQLTKSHGFPAATTVPKDERDAYKQEKAEVLQLLADLSCEQELLWLGNLILRLPALVELDEHGLDALLNVLPQLVANLHLVFKEQGAIDFTELGAAARLALGGLDSPSDLALALDYNIQHILVDEFQDTSIGQYELLQQLTAGWQPGDNKTLFLVGDPNQSIYSFRQADPRIFQLLWRQGFPNIKLKTLSLSANFRSGGKLVSWLNNLSSKILTRQGNLTYVASLAQQADTGTINYYDTAVESGENSDDIEAKNIVRLVQEKLIVEESSNIGILVRSRTHAQAILAELNAAAIKYDSNEIEMLQDSPVVQDLLGLTKAILHLGDKVAWLALLRAPWCGLELRDISLLLHKESKATVWQQLQGYAEITELSSSASSQLAKIIPILSTALQAKRYLSLRELISETFNALGGEIIYSQPRENQDKLDFYQLLEQLTLEQTYELDTLENKLETLYAKPLADSGNRVQVMTIHKAKGLEFDIVILPGIAKTTRSEEKKLLEWSEVAISTTEYLPLLAPLNVNTEYKLYDLLRFYNNREKQLEFSRILYVAVTRAKSELHLFVDSSKKARNQSFWSQLKTSVASDAIEPCKNLIATVKKDAEFSRRLISVPPENFAIRTTNEYIQSQPSNRLEKAIGTRVHAILYWLSCYGTDKSSLVLEKHLELSYKFFSSLGFTAKLAKQAAAIVAKAIDNILQDPKGVWILQKHHDAKSEWELEYLYQNKLRKIIIDRFFTVDEHNAWIIDYKVCMHQTQKQNIDAGTKQLKFYRNLLRQMRPEKLKTALYLPLQQQFIEV